MNLEQRQNHLWALRGPLDAQSVPKFWKPLLRLIRQEQEVTLELSGVDDIDTAGLATLITLMSEARAANCRLQFESPGDKIARLAEVNGVQHWFPEAANR